MCRFTRGAHLADEGGVPGPEDAHGEAGLPPEHRGHAHLDCHPVCPSPLPPRHQQESHGFEHRPLAGLCDWHEIVARVFSVVLVLGPCRVVRV